METRILGKLPGVGAWDAKYPDAVTLRGEVRAAADAFIEALTQVVREPDVSGIYVKGSTLKAWDSPIDYVPVLSDVDVHVLFANEEAHKRHLGAVEQGLVLSQRAESLYHNRIPHPIHVPRIQMVVANRLFADPEYIPSPIETVQERFGIPYPRCEPDLDRSRGAAINRTLAAENVEYLDKLGDKVADLGGPHLRSVLRDLSWRVSPTGPRILELRGIAFHTAWTSNRTEIYELLAAIDETDMASSYAGFYLAGWEYFLSGDRDGEPARRAILAASRVLRRAITIARELRQFRIFPREVVR
jgi:hypothetical protein